MELSARRGGRSVVFVILALFVASIVFGSIDLAAVAQTSVTKTSSGAPLPTPGRVIVVLQKSEFSAAADVAAAASVEPTHIYDNVLGGFSATVNNTQLQALAKNPAVSYIAADRQKFLASQEIPTHIKRSGIDKYAPAAIDGVDNAANVDIGIIDSGIEWYHSDLNVVGGYNCATSDPSDYDDYDGHGTHVAGIAGARDNSQGVVGAAPGARLWALRVMDFSGQMWDSYIICALNMGDANGNPLEVVNMSLGGTADPSTCTSGYDPLHQAVCDAVNRGTTIVVAAGNDASDAGYYSPASYAEVIAVGAVTDYNGAPGGGGSGYCTQEDGPDDSYANYSNYGSVVDIAASGSCINSTFINGGYAHLSGTSMASPLVAGAAALYKASSPGASPAQVRSWLLSDAASKPQSSSVGYSGGPTGTNRILYLGSLPGTGIGSGMLNPSFAGNKASISSSFDTPNTGTSGRAHDGATWSNWASAANRPAYVKIKFDLGADRQLTGVKWKMAYLGYADKFTVRVYSTGGSWQDLGTFTNPGTAQTWYGVAASGVTARYIELIFLNPNKDAALGSVSEVEIWAQPVVNWPGYYDPSMSGTKVNITNSLDSPSTGTSARARDGNAYSNWATSANYPSTATLTFDLGSVQSLTGVRWQFGYLGYSDEFNIRVSSSYGGAYQDLGTFGNAEASYTWFGIPTSASGRFVQFVFLNPNNDPALGSLAEVEIYKQVTEFPPGEMNPSLYGTKIPITGSWDTPYSGTSSTAHDGVGWSNWSSGRTPAYAKVKFDLGQDYDIGGIQWRMAYLGYADKFTIRVYSETGTWQELGTFGNPSSAQTWFGIPINVITPARYVEFIFFNPDSEPAVGSLSEVEIYGYTLGFTSTSSERDPHLSGTPQPITCHSDPVSSNENANAAKACDSNGGTNWHTDPTTPDTATLTIDLESATELTGVKWNFAQQGNADQFEVTVINAGVRQSVGRFSGGAANAYEGVRFREALVGDQVELTFSNLNDDADLGYLAEVEVWGISNTGATPQASPEASPAASPVAVEDEAPQATPAIVASPVPAENPAASPVGEGAPRPVADDAPDTTNLATPVLVEEPGDPGATPRPVTEVGPEDMGGLATPEAVDPTAPIEPTSTVAPTATATTEPTATVEPTAAISTGTITGTDGDLVNCRLSPVDGQPISQLSEGDPIEVTGPAEDGWYPVICDGQAGYVSADFVALGNAANQETLPTETTEPSATETVTDEPSPTAITTEEATTTPEPTEEPERTPYPIYDTGDTEQSHDAVYASDNDPDTWWSVVPNQSPDQTRLYFDLGSVLPIDRITIELAVGGMLPVFEIWLSEDADVWYNATPNGINGWNLWADEAHVFRLGYDARYIRIVIPNVDESGLSEVGGIRQVEIWAEDISQTQYLSALGEPTTPTPAPEPTAEPTVEPTEEAVAGPTEEYADEPTEEPTSEPMATEEVTPTEEQAEEAPVGDETPPDDGEPAADETVGYRFEGHS